jgi:glycosyltransferase involved in cell wall biosynthesis
LYGLRADVLLRGAAARAGARVVSAIRSTDPWRRWWHTALDSATARHVTLWISNSEAGSRAAMARQRLDPNRVVTVPSGVEGPDLTTPGTRERLRREARAALSELLPEPLPTETMLWVCLANLRWMKGHDMLVRAWAKVLAAETQRAAPPPWILAMVGADGPDRAGLPLRPQLEALIASFGIQRHCLLPGPGDAARYLAAADAAVLASEHEGMPASLLEAMAWQLPVVATAVGGITEMVDDGREGLLVKSSTDRAAMIAELAAAMHALSADTHRREAMGCAARERHQRHHQLAHMISRLNAIYAAVAGGRHRAQQDRAPNPPEAPIHPPLAADRI